MENPGWLNGRKSSGSMGFPSIFPTFSQTCSSLHGFGDLFLQLSLLRGNSLWWPRLPWPTKAATGGHRRPGREWEILGNAMMNVVYLQFFIGFPSWNLWLMVFKDRSYGLGSIPIPFLGDGNYEHPWSHHHLLWVLYGCYKPFPSGRCIVGLPTVIYGTMSVI